MYKILSIQFVSLFISINVYAQKTEDFSIPLPADKVNGSLYNKFQFLDSRPDTTSLGIVQTGAFNKKAKVIAKTSLSVQLAAVFNTLIDPPAKEGGMLFQLRQCSFAEVTSAVSEKGYFCIRAKIYSNKDGQYQEIRSIDTMIIKSAMDVTKGLLKTGGDTFTWLIANELSRGSAGPVYSYQEVLKIDSVEKSKMKLYTSQTYTDGLYFTYKSFMNQLPDKQIILKGKNLNDGDVKIIGGDGKPQKIKEDDIYAVVYKGQPYIYSRYNYYPLKKQDGDFSFTGKAQVTARTGEVAVAAIMFGTLGAIGMSATDIDATFDIKIDPISGGFIRLKEIKGTRSSVWDN